MANLHGLIRLRRFQLDEKRQVLAELHRLAGQLIDERARLDQSVEAEKQAALDATEPGAAFAFGSFYQGARERRGRLEESLQKVEIQVAAATDAVRDAFGEVKKFEQTEAQREARETKRRVRLDTIQLDEIGLEGYRRRAADTEQG